MAIKICLVVAVLVAFAHAEEKFWVGLNSDFNNPENWRGVNPITGTPSELVLSTTQSVVTFVKTGIYSVGKKITLGSNTKLSFDQGQVKLQFDESITNSVPATFKPGLDDDVRRHLTCHTNWKKGLLNQLENSDTPLCDTDVGVFGALDSNKHTYYVTVPASVEYLAISGIRFNGQGGDTLKTCDALSPYSDQFKTPTPCASKLFFDDLTQCRLTKQYANGHCFCHSSCPTPAMKLAQDAQLSGAAAAIAAAQLNATEVTVTREFSGSLTAAAVGVAPTALASFMADPAQVAALQTALVAALASKWGVPESAINITELSYDAGSVSITVRGTITAPLSHFLTSTSTGTTDVFNSLNNGFTVSSLTSDQSTLISTIRAVTATTVGCGCASSLPSRQAGGPRSFDVGSSLPYAYQARMIDRVNQDRLEERLSTGLNGFLGLYNTRAFTFSLVPLVQRRRASDHLVRVAFSYDFDCASGSSAAVCDPLGKTSVYTATKTRIDLLLAQYDVQASQCYNLVTGISMSCVQDAVLAAYRTVILAGGDVAAALAAANAKYVDIMKCNPSATAEDGTCIDPSSAPNLADINTAATAAALTASGAYNYSISNVTTGAPTVQPAAQTNSESGGGLPLAIIAAAAGGGAALIIIILLIVMRRRKRPANARTATQDRNVVAFENPMYDEPAHGGAAAIPSYEQQGSHGLYDEPAFSAAAAPRGMENPMYESTENLAAGAGGQGYLDVAPDEKPDDGGYLEQAAPAGGEYIDSGAPTGEYIAPDE